MDTDESAMSTSPAVERDGSDARRSDDAEEGIEAYARRILRAARLLDATWDVRRIARRDHRTIEIDIGPIHGKVIRIRWTQHDGDPPPALAAGPAYAASFMRGPEVWDADAPATPAAVRLRAVGACRALALGRGAPTLVAREATVRRLPIAAPAPRAPLTVAPEAVNLVLTAPCSQRCSFCGLAGTVPVSADPRDGEVMRHESALREAGALGTRRLRINGIEPLESRSLFHLLGVAREAGLSDFDVYSTCRPLADRAFAERFVAAMPATWRVVVPLYGATAVVHDAVVGSPGAFADVMAAVANLDALAGRDHFTFDTVVLRQNVDDLARLAELIRPFGAQWNLHLAFPSGEDPARAQATYAQVAVRHRDVLAHVYPRSGPPLGALSAGEIPPCVELRYQEETGIPLLSASRLAKRQHQGPGRRYVGTTVLQSRGSDGVADLEPPHIACAHRDGCALASICPGTVLSGYAEVFGLEELQPVSQEEAAAAGVPL
jgi:hypothetical protein